MQRRDAQTGICSAVIVAAIWYSTCATMRFYIAPSRAKGAWTMRFYIAVSETGEGRMERVAQDSIAVDGRFDAGLVRTSTKQPSNNQ